jgi:pilus assembly protein Flp/PilA
VNACPQNVFSIVDSPDSFKIGPPQKGQRGKVKGSINQSSGGKKMASRLFVIITMIENALMVSLSRLFPVKSQKGVTMIEYGLIAALVSVIVIATLVLMGSNLQTIFTSISDALASAV